jgi:hypothetical protein
MAIASGSRVQLVYQVESTHGVAPGSPDVSVLRTTSRNVNLNKNLLESAEARSDGMESDVRHGFNQVVGSPGFQLGLEDYDDMIEYGMGVSWATITTSGSPDMGAVAASDTFTRATGSWVTDGFVPGMMITTTGFTESANNGTFRVLTVAATSIGVDAELTDEASGPGQTLVMTGKIITIGTTLTTFTLERQWLDITKYQLFHGCAINTMDFTVNPEAIANCSLGILGMKQSAAISGTPFDATATAASSNEPFSSFEGTLYEGGSSIAVVTGMTLNVNRQRALQPVLMSKFSPDVFEGIAQVTGTLDVLMEDETLMNKFYNETGSKIWMKIDDPDGTNFWNIGIPNLKYTGAEQDPPQTGPVIQSLPFRGLRDSTSQTSLWIQRSNS